MHVPPNRGLKEKPVRVRYDPVTVIGSFLLKVQQPYIALEVMRSSFLLIYNRGGTKGTAWYVTARHESSGKAAEGDDLKSGELLASEDWFLLTVDRKSFYLSYFCRQKYK